MQNYSLLKTVGRMKKPVLLKRGMAATINDMLLSAEYILSEGNENVILCERGVRSFDPAARNMLDLTAIPIVHRLSHLPIIADPSHGTGLRDKVIPMARSRSIQISSRSSWESFGPSRPPSAATFLRSEQERHKLCRVRSTL